jgi:hypothetical protein
MADELLVECFLSGVLLDLGRKRRFNRGFPREAGGFPDVSRRFQIHRLLRREENMIKRIIAAAVVSLAATAGVGLAATQLSTSPLTQVCVNDVNGLVRADSVCRDNEHPATIGAGGNTQVTQNGTFTVPSGQTVGKTLPLTGITISGTCPEPQPGMLLARPLLEAASGQTMDAFATVGNGTIGGTSLLLPPVGIDGPATPGKSYGATTAVVSSRGATATATVGGTAAYSGTTKSCTFLWQAVEAPN